MSADLYPPTGVANPVVMVPSGSSVTIAGAGAAYVRDQVSDFQPVRGDAVMFRLDGGQLGAADAPRGDGPRAGAPANLTWPVRTGRVAGGAAPAPSDAAGLELVRHNGRPALGFAEGSTGLAVPWGPFTGPSFTAIVVMRTRRTVNAYGPYPGTGAPIPILMCPGHLAFTVPTGGPAPAALGGVPWDVALLNRWSIVTLENDAAAGLRRVYVHEHLVAQTAASTTNIPAGQVVVGGPGLEVSEVIVWDAVLTEAETHAMIAAAETKADVTTATAPNTTLPDARNPTNAWPVGVPRPDVWLDAALPGALFWDAAGTQPTPPGGIVTRWRDASGNGRDWTLGAAAGAVWRTDSTLLALGRRAGVQIPGGASWPTGLFSATGPFTVAVVFRPQPGSVVHPLCVGGASRFGADGWTEALGLNTPVALVSPPPAWTLSEPVLWGCTRGGTDTLGFHLGGLDPGLGGTHHTGASADTAWAGRPLTFGATVADGSSILAAAMVWRTANLTGSQTATLQAWLTVRWGLAPARLPGTLHTLNLENPLETAQKTAGLLDPATLVLHLDATVLDTLFSDNAGTVAHSGQAEGEVRCWRSRVGTNCLTATQAFPGEYLRYAPGTPTPRVEFVSSNQYLFNSNGSHVYAIPRPLASGLLNGATFAAVVRLPPLNWINGHFFQMGYGHVNFLPYSNRVYEVFGLAGRVDADLTPHMGTDIVYAVVANASQNLTRVFINDATVARASGTYGAGFFVNADAIVRQFRGALAEFRLYRAPLSDAQLQTLFRTMGSRHGVTVTGV